MSGWDDPGLTKGKGGGSDFYSLQQGENRLRIVSKPAYIGKHFSGPGQQPIVCRGADEGCAGCIDGVKVSSKWLLWVIDRADSVIKQAELGYSIIKAINELGCSDQFGFESMPEYDLTINKKGSGLETEYSVLPDRADTPLTEEEKANVSELDSPEDIVESLKRPEEQTKTEPF